MSRSVISADGRPRRVPPFFPSTECASPHQRHQQLPHKARLDADTSGRRSSPWVSTCCSSSRADSAPESCSAIASANRFLPTPGHQVHSELSSRPHPTRYSGRSRTRRQSSDRGRRVGAGKPSDYLRQRRLQRHYFETASSSNGIRSRTVHRFQYGLRAKAEHSRTIVSPGMTPRSSTHRQESTPGDESTTSFYRGCG